MAFGDYAKQTWAYGTTAFNPTTWQPQENKVNEIDDELAYSGNYRFDSLKRYFWFRNCKEIHMFDDSSDWTGVNATVSEASDPVSGNEDVLFYDTDNVASTIAMHDTITSIDLTKFNDGESSTTDDVIALSVDIMDYTAFTAGLTLKIGEDSLNYYYYTFSMTEDGRVTFQAKKSAFSQTGVPAGGWGAITYVRLETTTDNGAMGKTITGLSLMMYRNDPDTDGQGQPFQIYSGSAWSNFFTQSTALWNLIFDPCENDLGIILHNDENTSGDYDGLKVKSSVVNFVWKSIYQTKFQDYTTIMTWYVDSSNYAACWINNDTFTLKVNEASSPSSETYSLVTSLQNQERVEIKLEKNGATIRATLEKGNEKISILEYETSIDTETEGDLYYGYDTAGLCFIQDFIISNVNNMDLDSWDKPKVVLKKYDETVNNSNTMQNDDELFAYLPPNSFFEIEMCLIIQGANATPDFKCDWVLTNGTQKTIRYGWGPPTGVADVLNSNTEFYAMSALTFDCPYGVDGTANESVIFEKFFISTNENGASIQLRWAQNAAHASDTTIEAGSCLKITKVDMLQTNL